MQAMRNPRIDFYLLCSTPRTGSILLCSLLISTGVADRPESYFRAQDLGLYATRWDIRRSDDSFTYSEYLKAAIAAGRSDNVVFAARIMWGTMEELMGEVLSGGANGNDREVLSRAFDTTSYIYLYRRDVIAQAVSRARAEQTDLWHITGDSVAPLPQKEVQLNYEQIDGFVREVHEHNKALIGGLSQLVAATFLIWPSKYANRKGWVS